MTQETLPLPEKKFSRKQITLILTLASMLGLIAAFVLTLIPSAMEVKAMEILENQTQWHQYQELIDANNLENLQYQVFQEDLESINEDLRNQIELSFDQGTR